MGIAIILRCCSPTASETIFPGILLSNPLVGSGLVKILDVFSDHMLQMSFPHNQQVIEAFSPHTSQEPFADRIGHGSAVGNFRISIELPFATRAKASPYLPSRSRIRYRGVWP